MYIDVLLYTRSKYSDKLDANWKMDAEYYVQEYSSGSSKRNIFAIERITERPVWESP